jgi:drug/metabolite transporter (DMT)-like permease
MLFIAYGFGNTQIALFGVCLLVSGVLGSVAYTIYIKKTIKYKTAIVCACVLSFVFIIINALLMNFVSQQNILISMMILGMGFNFVPLVPISYDLGCELTFPVG